MASWINKNWSFGLAALALLPGYYSTPFGLVYLYWLYILGRLYPFAFLLFAWLVLIAALILRAMGKRAKLPATVKGSVIFIILVSNILATFFAPVDFIVRMADYRGHLLSVRYDFQVYHLVINAPDSVPPTYSLYQCGDGLGLFCAPVARYPARICKGYYPGRYSFYRSSCQGTTLKPDLAGRTIDVLENGQVVGSFSPSLSSEKIRAYLLLGSAAIIVAAVAFILISNH